MKKHCNWINYHQKRFKNEKCDYQRFAWRNHMSTYRKHRSGQLAASGLEWHQLDVLLPLRRCVQILPSQICFDLFFKDQRQIWNSRNRIFENHMIRKKFLKRQKQRTGIKAEAVRLRWQETYWYRRRSGETASKADAQSWQSQARSWNSPSSTLRGLQPPRARLTPCRGRELHLRGLERRALIWLSYLLLGPSTSLKSKLVKIYVFSPHCKCLSWETKLIWLS